MKNFYQWCEDREFDLKAILTEEPPQDKETKAESGSAKRAAVRGYAYPPAYGYGQYPKTYFRPIAADAPVYQQFYPDPANPGAPFRQPHYTSDASGSTKHTNADAPIPRQHTGGPASK